MKTEDIDRKIGMPDIDMEWAKFEKEVIEASEEKNKVESGKWNVESRIWSRAAMITGIIMSVSLITFASIYLYSTPQEKTEPQETGSEMAVTASVQEIIKTDTLTINREVFKFDNIEMKTIAKKIGDYYGKKIVFENEEAKHVRLYIQIEKSKSIEEIVEFMNNFKKVHLTIEDNSIHIR
jgi:hypothetical protein